MAWTGLNLTVEGRAALNKAQTDKHLNFKSIVVGDGNPPGNFSTVSRLVHQLYELTDLKIDTTDTGCMLTADLPDVDYDYYMREIGVIVTTDDGEKMYVYDNCGSDAQYIVSTTGTEKTQKRIRLSLLVSDVKNITVSQPSILYVAYDDFENAVDELEQKKVDISGGDISDTVATIDETAGDATDNIASGESLRTILSKVYKVIRQFFIHKSDTVIHTTQADKNKLAGIEEHANNYVHPDTHPAGMITSDANHRFVTDDKIEAWDNSLGASKNYTDGMYRQATAYADKKVADLIGGAPESLDTLKEVADAIKENESVMDALDAAVGKKANQSELDTHVDNSTIHITSQEREKWNGSVSKTGDASNTTVAFTESTREKPTSGEKLSTIVGKIVKWLADLKTVAFSGSYSDLTNKPASLPANGGTATYANYVNVVASNEVRFGNKPSKKIDLFFNWAWADGTQEALINSYSFMNGNGENFADIKANRFIGDLSAANFATPLKHSKKGAWISARDFSALISECPTGGSFAPIVSVGATYGVWTIGNLAGEQALSFIYTLDSDYSAGNNKCATRVTLPANASGNFITDGNIGSQSVNYANSAGSVAWSNVSGKPSTFPPASHSHSDYLTIKGAQDINTRIAASEGNIADIRDRLSSARLKMTWDGEHLCHYIDGSLIGYMMKTYSSDTFYPVYEVLTFKTSNNVLFHGDKGNYIVGVSAYSDARLKKNINISKVNAVECLNEIEMCEYDFIDEKYGAHSELGYIAQQLQKVIPECVVAVPQDKEQMGYDELYQVQDTHLIPYLVKAIQELSSKVAELEKKIAK